MPQVVTVGTPSHNEAGAVNGTSIAVTRVVQPGSTLSIAVTVADTGTITNVTDGTTTLTVPDVSLHWTLGAQWIAIFTFLNHTGGSFTFTANFTPTSQFRQIEIVELANVEAVDGTSSGQGTSAAPSSGNITPTRDGGYQVGYGLGATALTSGSGWTDLFNDPTIITSDLEGRQRPDKSALAATWTMTSGNWGAVAVQYRPLSVLGYQAGLRTGPKIGPRDQRGIVVQQAYQTTQAISNITLTADVGSLVLTGFAPSMSMSLAAGVGSLLLTGFAPSASEVMTAGLGQLVLNGFAPSMAEAAAAGLGQLILNGFAPTMSESATAGLGQLLLAGFAPSMTGLMTADVGGLILTGFIPSIGLTSDIVLFADVGQLLLTGFAPTIDLVSNVVAGTGPKRRTGNEILDVLQAFESGQIESVAEPLQEQRDADVHTALDNADADDEQTALILYWLHGGF